LRSTPWCALAPPCVFCDTASGFWRCACRYRRKVRADDNHHASSSSSDPPAHAPLTHGGSLRTLVHPAGSLRTLVHPARARARARVRARVRVRVDALLCGRYGAGYIRGMQEREREGEGAGFARLAASPKHFVGYDLEGSTFGGVTWNRHNFTNSMTAQELVEYYALPFRHAVQDGGALGMMCSYNAVNVSDGVRSTGSIPACAFTALQDGMARGQWNFSGYPTRPPWHKYCDLRMLNRLRFTFLRAGFLDCGTGADIV
jgi:hypothetical protein